MSALYNMISALVAMLIAFALAHFGAAERVKIPTTDTPASASQPMKSDDANAPSQKSAPDADQDQPSSQ